MCFLPKAETLCVTGVVSERRTSPLRRKSDAGTHTHTHTRERHPGTGTEEVESCATTTLRMCWSVGGGEGRGRSFPHAQQGSGVGGVGGDGGDSCGDSPRSRHAPGRRGWL